MLLIASVTVAFPFSYISSIDFPSKLSLFFTHALLLINVKVKNIPVIAPETACKYYNQ